MSFWQVLQFSHILYFWTCWSLILWAFWGSSTQQPALSSPPFRSLVWSKKCCWVWLEVLIELLCEFVETLQRSEVFAEQLIVLFFFLEQFSISLLYLASRHSWYIGQYGLCYHAFLPILPASVVLFQMFLIGLLDILTLFILPLQILADLFQFTLSLLQQRLTRDLNFCM